MLALVKLRLQGYRCKLRRYHDILAKLTDGTPGHMVLRLTNKWPLEGPTSGRGLLCGPARHSYSSLSHLSENYCRQSQHEGERAHRELPLR